MQRLEGEEGSFDAREHELESADFRNAFYGANRRLELTWTKLCIWLQTGP